MQYPQFNKVFLITGLKSGGKDTFSDWLTERDFNVRRVSDAIREECAQRGQTDPPVQMLQDIGNWGREHSGDNGFWIARLLAMQAREGNPLIAINGIRHPGEVEAARQLVGDRATLVAVVAPTMTRYQRAAKRQQAGDPLNFEDWLAMDDRDRGIGEPADGQQVDRCIALCEYENLYNNAGSLEDYKHWFDECLQRHLVTA